MERELESKYDICNSFIQALGSVPNNLPSIMEMHKKIWRSGVRHPGFGPDEYGVFRTEDILTMSPDEIYLGTSGLMTNTMTYWEDRKNHDLSEFRRNGAPELPPPYYVDVCDRYKNLLRRNLKMMRSQMFDNGIGREKLCRNITDALNKIGEYNQGSVTSFGGMEILNTSIADNRILNCRFSYRGREVTSSFLNLSGRFLIPEGFKNGVQLSPMNARSFKYIDAMQTLRDEGRVKAIDLEEEAGKAIRTGSLSHGLTRSEAKENIANVRRAEKCGFRFGV